MFWRQHFVSLAISKIGLGFISLKNITLSILKNIYVCVIGWDTCQVFSSSVLQSEYDITHGPWQAGNMQGKAFDMEKNI